MEKTMETKEIYGEDYRPSCGEISEWENEFETYFAQYMPDGYFDMAEILSPEYQEVVMQYVECRRIGEVANPKEFEEIYHPFAK